MTRKVFVLIVMVLSLSVTGCTVTTKARVEGSGVDWTGQRQSVEVSVTRTF